MTALETPRAFPSVAIDDAYAGMSLRDWFAGQALAALIDYKPGTAAKMAYAHADAMMAARLTA